MQWVLSRVGWLDSEAILVQIGSSLWQELGGLIAPDSAVGVPGMLYKIRIMSFRISCSLYVNLNISNGYLAEPIFGLAEKEAGVLLNAHLRKKYKSRMRAHTNGSAKRAESRRSPSLLTLRKYVLQISRNSFDFLF